jgi:hypothetical protein
VVQLICEGRCNPNKGMADSLADKFAECRTRKVAFNLMEDMIRVQRSLHYTEHIENGIDYVCLDCSHMRRFGR